MPVERIEHFADGLNLLLHPTQLKNSECQVLENMEVRPTSVGEVASYFALSARHTYTRLHTDTLPFIPKGMAEFTPRTGADSGKVHLVTGGFNSPNFELRTLNLSDDTATILTHSATSVGTNQVSFFFMGNKIYFTDGNIEWKSWDGTSIVALTGPPKTKYAVTHKNRVYYANDVTNGQPHYIWVSDVGDPNVVGASNFFAIGDASDPIIAIHDQVERVLIIKAQSTWAFYVAPTLADSTLLRAEEWRGSPAPRGSLWANYKTYVYTSGDGIHRVRGLTYQPVVLQLLAFLKGFSSNLLAMGFRENQLLISVISDTGQAANNRMFSFDLQTEKVYQSNLSIATFSRNLSTSSTSSSSRALEDNGSNHFFIEFDTQTGVETTVPCKLQTKDFTFGGLLRRACVQNVTVEVVNAAGELTLKVYADGVLKETKTHTQGANGIFRKKFDLLSSLNYGYYHSFELSYNQTQIAQTYTVLSMDIEYDVEHRGE